MTTACVTTISAPTTTVLTPSVITQPPAPVAGTVAAPSAPAVGLPDVPVWSSLLLTAVTIPTLSDMPEVTYNPPAVTIPDAPDALVESDLGEFPVIEYVAVADYIDRPLPPAPTITPVVFDDVPDYTFESFDDAVPVDTLGEPAIDFIYVELQYTVTLLDRILTGLATDSTGVSAASEAGLFERSTQRQREVASPYAMTELTSMFNRTLPPGAGTALIAGTVEAGELGLSDHAAMVHLKRADMRLEQKKFAWGKSVEYEETSLKFYEGEQTRRLASMRASAEVGIKLFETATLLAKARINAYNIASEVYTTRIRAAAQKLDIFKTQIETTKLEVSTQQIYADIYRTQLEGVQALVDIYKVRMQAAQIEAETQKMQLDVFKTAVDVFTARVNAKAVEGKLFEAQVRGETSKVYLYKAQAEAYGTAVEAYKTKAQSAELVTRAHIQKAEQNVSVSATEIEQYKLILDTSRMRMDAKLDLYSADVKRYEAETGAEADIAEANARMEKAYSDVIMKAAEMTKDFSVDYAKLDTVQAEIVARERLTCAEKTSKEMMAEVDIHAAEALALGDISSGKSIATAENSSAELIATSGVSNSELIALIGLNSNWHSSYNSIMSAEQSALTGIRAQWNADYTNHSIAVAKANADKQFANSTVNLYGDVQ